MIERQWFLFFAAGAAIVMFLAAALISYAATERKRARLERTAGDLALIFFLAAMLLVLVAVTNDLRLIAPASLVLAGFAFVALRFGPRCPQCGERFNVLTNRQFRRPQCLFCGAREE